MTSTEFEGLLLNSPTIQSILLKEYQVVLIYTVSPDAMVPTPTSRAYPPAGWSTKIPGIVTDKEYVFTSYGKLSGEALLPWTEGDIDYWTVPFKLNSLTKVSGETNSLISVPIDVYKITRTLEVPLITKGVKYKPEGWYTDLSVLELNSGYIWQSTAITVLDTKTGKVDYTERNGLVWSDPKCIGKASTNSTEEDSLIQFGSTIVFKASVDKPDKPVGGVYNFTSGKLDAMPAGGWSISYNINTSGNERVWQSTGVILGTTINWLEPVPYVSTTSVLEGSSTNSSSYPATVYLAKASKPSKPTSSDIEFNPPSTLTCTGDWKLTPAATLTEGASKKIWVSYSNYIYDFKNESYSNVRNTGWSDPIEYINIQEEILESLESTSLITLEMWNELLETIAQIQEDVGTAESILTLESVVNITKELLKILYNSQSTETEPTRAAMIDMNANGIKAMVAEQLLNANGETVGTGGSLLDLLALSARLAVFKNTNGTLDYSQINVDVDSITALVVEQVTSADGTLQIAASFLQMLKDKISFGVIKDSKSAVFTMGLTVNGESVVDVNADKIRLTGSVLALAIAAEQLEVGTIDGKHTYLLPNGTFKAGGEQAVFEPCGYGHVAGGLMVWGKKKANGLWFRLVDLDHGGQLLGEFYLEVLGTIKANAGGFGKFRDNGDLLYGWIIGTSNNDAYLIGTSNNDDKIILSPNNLRSESLVNKIVINEQGEEVVETQTVDGEEVPVKVLRTNWLLNQDGSGFLAGGSLSFSDKSMIFTGDFATNSFGFLTETGIRAKFEYGTKQVDSEEPEEGVYLGICPRGDVTDLRNWTWIPLKNFKQDTLVNEDSSNIASVRKTSTGIDYKPLHLLGNYKDLIPDWYYIKIRLGDNIETDATNWSLGVLVNLGKTTIYYKDGTSETLYNEDLGLFAEWDDLLVGTNRLWRDRPKDVSYTSYQRFYAVRNNLLKLNGWYMDYYLLIAIKNTVLGSGISLYVTINFYNNGVVERTANYLCTRSSFT